MQQANNIDKIRKISITPSTSILQALKIMDELQVKLLLVMEDNIFKGLLSIGDIQRAIIKNIVLDEFVVTILRSGILYAKEDTPFEEIQKTMLQYRTECMPVVNTSHNLVTAYFWEDVFGKDKSRLEAELNLPVVIMAGGKGTRLKPITNVLPKPLIPIGDKTILEHILDKFVAVGCHDFLMSVNYKAEMIMHYFDTLNNPDYKIEYFKEGNFLGTAGSLHLLKGRLSGTFFVSNCDIVVETDYTDIYTYHKEQQNDITIVGVVKHYPIPYGVLETEENGRLASIQEKPEFTFKINSGMYILEAATLSRIPENTHYHITELIDDIRKEGGKVGVFPVNEGAWLDIGEWSEYNKAAKKLGVTEINM